MFKPRQIHYIETSSCQGGSACFGSLQKTRQNIEKIRKNMKVGAFSNRTNGSLVERQVSIRWGPVFKPNHYI